MHFSPADTNNHAPCYSTIRYWGGQLNVLRDMGNRAGSLVLISPFRVGRVDVKTTDGEGVGLRRLRIPHELARRVASLRLYDN